MTTALRVTCRACGDVDLPIERARLVVGLAGPRAGAAMQFECPRCGAGGDEALDDRAVALLMAAGISMVASSVPQHPVGETPNSG